MMIRKTGSLALAAALVLGAGSLASAETLSGKVTRVDAKAKTFAVRSEQGVSRFSLGSEAQVMNAGAAAGFSALKRGEQVNVDFAVDHGNRVASRVEITAQPAAKTKKKAAAPQTSTKSKSAQ